ncbi:MAG: LptF/LptG family permease [Halanaerobiaceae bacterium]
MTKLRNKFYIYLDKIWKKRIVDIYIIKEILMPYIAGILIITIIGMSNILFEFSDFFINQGVPLDVVSKLLLFQLPDIMVQTFPIAILFATIYGMSRLKRENEFTSLRLGGISLYRLILPLVIVGVLISVMTFYINEKVVPWSNHEARNIYRYYILKQPMPEVQDNVFFKGPEGRLFFVNSFDEKNNVLEKVVVYNQPDERDYPEIITAQTGVVLDTRWRLEGGIIHRYTDEGKLHQALIFDQMEYEIVDEVTNFYGEQRTSAEMNRAKLRENIELFRNSGLGNSINSLLIDYHIKLSMPMAALIFILIGTPLSLSSKDSRASSIIITIVIIFLYYLFSSITKSFGKNGTLPPVLAAWLPNIIFGLVGVILMIWRENWKNFASKLLPFFGVIFFCGITLLASGEARAETLSVYKAETLSYNSEHGKYQLMGEIMGKYSDYYVFADTVEIKMEDGSEQRFSQAESIEMENGDFTGCNLEHPHYYFDASSVTIKPGEYLVARNVVFRELNGSLPLFYWPYLYISLQDRDQRLIPEVGYSNSRGWFLKTTYYYTYDNRLPGELYMQYYTKSGFAGGFKQHFLKQNDLEGYLYLFGQENRTNIDRFLKWQGEIYINNDRDQWQTDVDIDYDHYTHRGVLDGGVTVSNETNKSTFELKSEFSDTDNFDSDITDDRDLDFTLDYNYEFLDNWEYDLNLERNYRHNEEDGLEQRWQGETYVLTDIGDWDFQLTFEREAPFYGEEDEDEDEEVEIEERITSYRLPEFEVEYTPGIYWTYDLQLGNYLDEGEDDSRIRGLRGYLGTAFDKRWRFFNRIDYTAEFGGNGRVYKVLDVFDDYDYIYDRDEIPYLVTYYNNHSVTLKILKNLEWTNSYEYDNYFGESPFRFDSGETKESIESELEYDRGNLEITLDTEYDLYKKGFSESLGAGLLYNNRELTITLDTGYDLSKKEFSDPLITDLSWKIKKDWTLNANTSYNLETEKFGDLLITHKYSDGRWTINNGIDYDIERKVWEEIDNEIIYEVEDDLYVELNGQYDGDQEKFDSANLAIKKVFHCRSLTFRYDYVKKEYSLEYNINLFPEDSIKVGTSEEDPFMFDIGIEDLIEETD